MLGHEKTGSVDGGKYRFLTHSTYLHVYVLLSILTPAGGWGVSPHYGCQKCTRGEHLRARSTPGSRITDLGTYPYLETLTLFVWPPTAVSLGDP